jgi:O-antigen ligase
MPAVGASEVAATTERPTGRHAAVVGKSLPIWPLWLFFGGYPILWVLGLGGFATQLVAFPMLTYLLASRKVKAPRGFGVWILFLIWMSVSVVEVNGGAKVVGFVYRATLYLAATVFFLYVYNSSPDRLPVRRMAAMATAFLAFVVVGGYLGAAFPHHILDTPLGRVLPPRVANNDLASKLVKPPFAQLSQSTFFHVKPRPAAPFPYTNDWGVNFAFLVPFALAWIGSTRRLGVRVGVVVLLLLSAVPAILTLNRGMVFGLSVGVVYAAIRLAAKGHGRALLFVGIFAVAILAVSSLFHFGARLDQRLSNSSSNQGRLSVYTETFDEVKASPLLGYGAPASSTVGNAGPDLGTQGQFWGVLYGSGFPGVALFSLSLIMFAWKSRRASTTPLLWLHVVSVIAIAVVLVYRIEASELVILMSGVAIVCRGQRTVSDTTALPRTGHQVDRQLARA